MLTYIHFLADRYLGEKGQGIVEYAVLLAFVVAVAAYVGSNGSITSSIKTIFTNLSTMLTTKASS